MNEFQAPTEIILHKRSRILEVVFGNQLIFNFPCEYLRVFSPSAEVRGHGQPQRVVGKEHVNILSIEPVGNYAIKPIFSDGHASGIFSWKTLLELGQNQTENWNQYLKEIGKKP